MLELSRSVWTKPRLTPAMVLEHGDHVVDIFNSGEALALALPDCLRVAAALGDYNSWISMADNNIETPRRGSGGLGEGIARQVL